MSQAVSKDAIQRVANLAIVKKGATPAQNAKATAIELYGRASALEEAILTLGLDYTYEITVSDPKKIAARRQLGGMSREVLEAMRDELIVCGNIEWKRYETLSNIGSASDSGAAIPSEAETSQTA